MPNVISFSRFWVSLIGDRAGEQQDADAVSKTRNLVTLH